MTISTDYWLEIARREYLNGFISHGGAAVKFLVPSEGVEHHQLRDSLRDGLQSICQKDNFSFISVDSSSTKIHLIDRLFHEIAKNIEWDNFAYLFLQNLLSKEGYTLSPSRSDFKLRRLAELNDIEERFLT